MSIDISCICLTHGRPWLLAEAVESFRRQRLGGLTAELVIVNDCPEQRLTCNAPNVRILQGMAPFVTLAAKYDYAALASAGDWLAFWDDDDISLPDRLAWSMSLLPSRPSAVLVRPLWIWHMANTTIRGRGAAVICQGMANRRAWYKVGGPEPVEWIDQSLYFKLSKAGPYIEPRETAEECHYIYRWAGVGYHDSGIVENDPEQRARNFRAEALKDARFREGDIRVVPDWTQDYEAAARQAVRAGLYEIRV